MQQRFFIYILLTNHDFVQEKLGLNLGQVEEMATSIACASSSSSALLLNKSKETSVARNGASLLQYNGLKAVETRQFEAKGFVSTSGKDADVFLMCVHARYHEFSF